VQGKEAGGSRPGRERYFPLVGGAGIKKFSLLRVPRAPWRQGGWNVFLFPEPGQSHAWWIESSASRDKNDMRLVE
jgi:hypothetical protein